MQSDLARIQGVTLLLRLIMPGDAAYVHNLRGNAAYNRHLSAVTGTADDQRMWIERYKHREAAGQEFYYVIERLDAVPCGLVRLYDIAADQLTWGSWVLDQNKTRKAALESMVLSFQVAFVLLDKQRAIVDVHRGNDRAESLYRRLGMEEVGASGDSISFVYSRTRFLTDRDRHMSLLSMGEVQ